MRLFHRFRNLRSISMSVKQKTFCEFMKAEAEIKSAVLLGGCEISSNADRPPNLRSK